MTPSAVALALCAALAVRAVAGQENLGFEAAATAGALPPGWSLFGDDVGSAQIAIDATFAAMGERSLKVERSAATGATRLAQRLDAAALAADGGVGRRLRLSGQIRGGAGASLWLRIDGQVGALYLDSRGEVRESAGAVAGSGDSAGFEPATHFRQAALELPLPRDAAEIAYGVALRGPGVAWFDALALEVVDAGTLPPPAPAARRYLEDALAIMREHGLRAAAVDWPALRAATLAYARGAEAPGETYAAIRYALRELGDRHSYLQSPRVTDELRTAAVANARTGQGVVPPEGTFIDGRFAYLAVPGFAGGSAGQQVEFAESIKKLIQQHDVTSTCGWIVDLRRNSGGNLWPMLAGLGPLLGEGELAASVYPDGRRVAVWYRDGKAGFGDYVQLRVNGGHRLTAPEPPPVAVLIGPGTASSGEVLVLALRDRPRSRVFGAPTRGLTAGNRTFGLSDGAALVLTVAATADRSGRTHLGPLLPDERVATAGGGRGAAASAADGVVGAALVWLRTQAPCTRAVFTEVRIE